MSRMFLVRAFTSNSHRSDWFLEAKVRSVLPASRLIYTCHSIISFNPNSTSMSLNLSIKNPTALYFLIISPTIFLSSFSNFASLQLCFFSTLLFILYATFVSLLHFSTLISAIVLNSKLKASS